MIRFRRACGRMVMESRIPIQAAIASIFTRLGFHGWGRAPAQAAPTVRPSGASGTDCHAPLAQPWSVDHARLVADLARSLAHGPLLGPNEPSGARHRRRLTVHGRRSSRVAMHASAL